MLYHKLVMIVHPKLAHRMIVITLSQYETLSMIIIYTICSLGWSNEQCLPQQSFNTMSRIVKIALLYIRIKFTYYYTIK